MPDQHGFGDNGTESTRPRQSGQSADHMNEYNNEVAHPGNGINTSKTTALRPNLAIRHRQVPESPVPRLEQCCQVVRFVASYYASSRYPGVEWPNQHY
jgi:hypothetical protein